MRTIRIISCGVFLSFVLKLEVLYPWIAFAFGSGNIAPTSALLIAISNTLAETSCKTWGGKRRKMFLLLAGGTANTLMVGIVLCIFVGVGALQDGDLTQPHYTFHPALKLLFLFWLYTMSIRCVALFLDWLLNSKANETSSRG